MRKEIKIIKAYKPYNRVQTHPEGESLTIQDHGEMCDIRKLMHDHILQNGALPDTNNCTYGNSANFNPAEARETTVKLQNDFTMLSPEDQAKHNNDPKVFVTNVLKDIEQNIEDNKIRDQEIRDQEIADDLKKSTAPPADPPADPPLTNPSS